MRVEGGPAVVLVPGGFLGPWIWDDVVDRLAAVGVAAHTVALTSVGEEGSPLGDLYSDARSLRSVLDGLLPPVVLCAHSYGGAVVTEAAAGPHPAVGHLVYLAAAVPDSGASMADLAPAATGSSPQSASEAEAMMVGPDGSGVLVPDQARTSLFGDCTDERAAQAVARLEAFNLAVGTQPVRGAAWRELPATFVRCTHDALPELVAAGFLERADTQVVEMPTGHCPQWSRPDLVASLLLDRARSLR